MNKESKIYIAGHRGLVGSALVRCFQKAGYSNLIFRNHQELDLKNQKEVEVFFDEEKPEYVVLAAAKVGGIVANNTYRADFIYENLQIQNNVIHQSYLHNVKKLLFLGSSCIYPKKAPQPMKEESLLTSELEYTNEPYAIAKIAGLKMCEAYNIQYGTNFIAVMPTNLYGPGDNYDLEKSHVLPALVRKMHLGKCLEENDWKNIRADFSKNPVENLDGAATENEIVNMLKKYGISKEKNVVTVTLWGSGSPMREFLHSDDMANACRYILENVEFKALAKDKKEVRNCHINIGSGKDLSIKELALLIKNEIAFSGELFWDISKPDGTPQKLQDISKLIQLGWTQEKSLVQGIKEICQSYRKND